MALSTEVSLLATSLISVCPSPGDPLPPFPEGLEPEYVEFLATTNGGYTPDGFLHFFGLNGPPEHDIRAWNRPEAWKADFELDERAFVFAENILGNQYFYQLGRRRWALKVISIDSGTAYLCANSFSAFVRSSFIKENLKAPCLDLLRRYLDHSGETIGPFQHLSSKLPSFLGGDDEDLDNLELANSLQNLQFMGQLVGQVKNLPPGSVIRDVVLDEQTNRFKIVLQ